MTNFDAIVAGGPEAVALLSTRAKVAAIEKTCEQFGVEFSVSHETFERVYKEHLDYLLAEHRE